MDRISLWPPGWLQWICNRGTFVGPRWLASAARIAGNFKQPRVHEDRATLLVRALEVFPVGFGHSMCFSTHHARLFLACCGLAFRGRRWKFARFVQHGIAA